MTAASTALPCPALRLQILTGQCAHNSGVIGAGVAPLSGFTRFQARGLENQTVPYFLQAAGYRTGLTGKVGGARGPWGVGWVQGGCRVLAAARVWLAGKAATWSGGTGGCAHWGFPGPCTHRCGGEPLGSAAVRPAAWGGPAVWGRPRVGKGPPETLSCEATQLGRVVSYSCADARRVGALWARQVASSVAACAGAFILAAGTVGAAAGEQRGGASRPLTPPPALLV